MHFADGILHKGILGFAWLERNIKKGAAGWVGWVDSVCIMKSFWG